MPVIVHSPTNYDQTFTVSLPANILSRSSYFRTQIKAFTPPALPIIHIIAEFKHFEIVAHWLCTGKACGQDGIPPDMYTFTMIVFLAEILDLPMLSDQVVSMLRRKEHSESESPKSLPTYVEIYERTKAGNAMRRFVVEAYIHHELGNRKPAVPIEDLPHMMVLDILRHCQDAYMDANKIFDDRLAKAADEMKKTMTCHCDALVTGAVNDANTSRDEAAQAKLAADAACTELETLKKTHLQSLAANDRRYDELLAIMKARNQEHLEAVADMERITEERETRLKNELAKLRTIKEKYDLMVVEAASDADEILELKAKISKQAELAEDWKKSEEIMSKKIEELESEITKQTVSTKGLQDAKDLLSKTLDELQAELSKQVSSVETSRQNEENLFRQLGVLGNTENTLEENAGQQNIQIEELNRVLSNSEERNRKEVGTLQAKVQANQREVARLEARLKEKYLLL